MTKRYSIVEITNGAFDVVATGLSFVDSTLHAMALAWQVDGSFLEVADGTTAEDYRNTPSANNDPVQRDWAYL